MSLSVVNTPALVMLAIVVAPYLNNKLPPDSSIVKLVVVRLVTAPPSVMLPVDVTVPDKLRPLADPVPATEVTVPVPGAEAAMVWLGQVPVIVMLAPCSRAGVAVPVPPLATASVPAKVTAPDVAVLGVSPVVPPEKVDTPSTTLEAIFTKSEPSHPAKHFSPDTMVTPVVGPAPRNTTEPVPALMTMYALLRAGAVMLRVVAPLLAVHKRIA